MLIGCYMDCNCYFGEGYIISNHFIVKNKAHLLFFEDVLFELIVDIVE